MKKTFLNLIFSDEELKRLRDIYGDAIEQYLFMLHYDPFASNDAEEFLRDEVRIIISEKVEVFDDGQINFIANELYHEFI